jgi:hypothetical protein
VKYQFKPFVTSSSISPFLTLDSDGRSIEPSAQVVAGTGSPLTQFAVTHNDLRWIALARNLQLTTVT